ncbi:MAG: hydantoinase B/oxoprolinase family protein [Thermodesulfobacteriota bacterium]
MDIIEVEIFNKLFSAIAEEMGIVLQRSAFSSNIKERRDFSCAIFAANGELVAQAAHIPVHLGAMPATMNHVLAQLNPAAGDVIITNDPFGGGSHLPDITLLAPVTDAAGATLFHVACRAHHADVGGKTPGSMGFCHHIDDEGVLIPPTRLLQGGKTNKQFLREFLAQVRNPEERRGDLRAQEAALSRGRDRLLATVTKYGSGHLFTVLEELKDYGERLMAATIEAIPDGCYRANDILDDDGLDSAPLDLAVELTIKGEGALVDFCASCDQVTTPLNGVRAVTVSATMYCLQCLLGEGYPINHGTQRPITIITRPGSILDATHPSPVAAGNVETSQRVVDLLFKALAQALPQRVPAASCGSMNNIAIGDVGCGERFTYYETIGGGMGGAPKGPGASGIHSHMTNTLNTPVEALEHSFPLQIKRYELRHGSGGKGAQGGGCGLIRSYEFLEDAHLSLLAERRRSRPYGLQGGNAGRPGCDMWQKKGGERVRLAGKANIEVAEGDVVTIMTPGGGGWGEGEE